MTVVSLNPEVDPDIPALLGASAALAISGMPFDRARSVPRRSATRTATTFSTRPRRRSQESELDLVVAGTADAVLMVESEAKIACPKTSCSAPSCTATSRCRLRSTRSTSWRPKSASQAGTGKRRKADEELAAASGRENWRSPGLPMPTRSATRSNARPPSAAKRRS